MFGAFEECRVDGDGSEEEDGLKELGDVGAEKDYDGEG